MLPKLSYSTNIIRHQLFYEFELRYNWFEICSNPYILYNSTSVMYVNNYILLYGVFTDISLDTTPFGLSLPADHTSDQPTNSKPSDIKKNTLGSDTKISPSHTTLTTTVKPDIEIQKESTTKQPSSLAADSPEKVPVFPSTSTPGKTNYKHAGKHEMLNRCWFNVWPMS